MKKKVNLNNSHVEMKARGEEERFQKPLSGMFLTTELSEAEALIKSYQNAIDEDPPIKVDPIELKLTSKEIKSPNINYAVPLNLKNDAVAKIQRLLKSGIIEESNERNRSPAFFKKKKN